MVVDVKVETNNNVEEQPEPLTQPKFQIVLWCFMTLNVLNHILVLLVTGYLLYISIGSKDGLNLHVLLCTVGYVLLMAEGLVVLAGENVWSRSLTRSTKSHVHIILQVVGAVTSITGTVIAIIGKDGPSNLNSSHGQTGKISIVLVIISAMLGLPALFAGRLRKLIKPVISKFGHNLLGTLCFIVGIVTQCSGYYTDWMMENSTTELRNACYWLTIIISILCLTGAARHGGQQIWGITRRLK